MANTSARVVPTWYFDVESLSSEHMRLTTAWGHDTVQDRCSINAPPMRALHVSSSGRLQFCVLLQVLLRQLTLTTTWLQLNLR